MELITYTPTPDEYAYTFGGVAPVMTVKPGTALRLWSEDAFGGVVDSPDVAAGDVLRPGFLNPQTGPFRVEGAQPGDTLALHLVDLEPARSWGASSLIPFFGGLTSTDVTASLQEALPQRTWIYEIDSDNDTVGFIAQSADLQIPLPLAPMLGTVGVAPFLESRTTLTPERFGGNMDTPEMKAGTTVYLGVNVEGAMFSIGDGHYRQGEGEACGTAVEGAMTTTLVVDLIKGGAPAWPRLENDTHWMVVGSARPMEDAWRIATGEMTTWIAEALGLDRMDAYQLVAQAAEVPVANVVDVNYSIAVKMAKAYLPGVNAYDGIHAHLRATSTGLGGR